MWRSKAILFLSAFPLKILCPPESLISILFTSSSMGARVQCWFYHCEHIVGMGVDALTKASAVLPHKLEANPYPSVTGGSR